MLEFTFYFFAVLTLLSGIMVATSRNLVNGAMFMILTFVGMAGLFIMLESYFLAALQVLVYAGAVVVLFLFIIMLLDVDKTARIPPPPLSTLASLAALVFLVAGVLTLLSPDSIIPPLPLADPAGAVPANFGRVLFTKYMLPFQVAGFLLLVAMIGVILLGKRRNAGGSAAKPLTAHSTDA